MRFAGKMEPAVGAGPRTGHPGCLSPARIVATREILSARVRDFGCVATVRRIAESGEVVFAPLRALSAAVDAVFETVGGVEAAVTTPGEESFVGAFFVDERSSALSPPHAATISRLDDNTNGRRGIGIVWDDCNGRTRRSLNVAQTREPMLCHPPAASRPEDLLFASS
jgi:hypothetical protein